jgi:hypothetical protein
VKVYDNRNKPAPNSYNVVKSLGSQGVPRYSMGMKLPGRMQSIEKASVLPSPFHYSVKTGNVLPTNYKKIGFGYGVRSNEKDRKLSPGPGDYNLGSFTDKFKTSFYKEVRRQQMKSFSLQPSPRDCSMAKPLTGGVFDPMGVVTKEKTVGFNYPPLKSNQFSNAAKNIFYSTDGFNKKNRKDHSIPHNNLRMSAMHDRMPNNTLPEVEMGSDKSSISGNN